MEKNKILILLASLFISLGAVLVFFSIVEARIGVGVAIGKIEMDKPLKPGSVYDLTPLVILNTGDEPADYAISLAFQSDQPELRPSDDWFKFEPQTFHLEPGKSQNVAVRLTLPIKTKLGNYFAYLEGHPLVKASGPGTTINVAAATKLYFTVAPANIFQGIFYRVSAFIVRTAPWSYIVLFVVAGALLFAVIRRFFNFNIGVSFKKK